jgi:hypothetical protein
MTRSIAVLALLGVACTSGCNKDDDLAREKGAAPPPVASSRPGACASGGGSVKDEVSAKIFPRLAEDYCIDPHGETRAYGESASGSLDQVCTELLDGECEVYKRHGLKRVVTVRYIDGKGSPGTIAVNLSRFDNKEGAYSFYTKRVIADADPAAASLSVIELPGQGTLGSGIAYVWRGEHVAELSYTNELEPPQRIKATSQRVLPPLAKKLAEQLPGEPSLPAAAAALPKDGHVRLGTSYVHEDVLGISGLGPGALGYYKDGSKRWRLLSVVRPDQDAAADVMRTLKKVDGVKTLKPPPIEALAMIRRDSEVSPEIEWIIARRDNRIFGVGDEPAVLNPDNSEEENRALKLTREQKLEKLQAAVERP